MIIDFFKKFFAIDSPAAKGLDKKSKKPARKKIPSKSGSKSSKKKKAKIIKKIPKRKKLTKKTIRKKPTPKKRQVKTGIRRSKPQVRRSRSKKAATKTKKVIEKEIGKITHYFDKISVGIIKLKRPLRVNDAIHIKGAHSDFIQIVASLQVNHKDIARAEPGAEAGIKVIQKVHANDKVYVAG